MNLYWVTTKTKTEDWFMIAKSESEAAETHEYFEGFGQGDARAKLVCEIPTNLITKYRIIEPDWPSPELIEDLGGKFVTKGNPSKVNINGKLYTEGRVTEPVLIDLVDKRKGVYIIRIQGTDKYKIGKTKNLKQRLKQFETANPENIKVVYFIASNEYLGLERHLHSIFQENRISGEWFEFDDQMMEILEQNLYVLQTQGAKFFKIFNFKDISIQSRSY